MIVDPWVLLAFLPAALALNLTPGCAYWPIADVNPTMRPACAAVIVV